MFFRVRGPSMEPTLRDGQLIWALRSSSPVVGDIIVFRYQNKTLIKRLIAFDGSRMTVRGDNPDAQDSRYYGPVPLNCLVARAIFRF